MNIKRELILYILFGVLTTLVNIIVYFFFARLLSIHYLLANVLAWFFSVLFAYITNRIWVFESKNDNIIKECTFFIGGRLFSGAVDTGLMYLFIDILSVGDFISKIVIQIIVVILNYLLSKLVIFK